MNIFLKFYCLLSIVFSTIHYLSCFYLSTIGLHLKWIRLFGKDCYPYVGVWSWVRRYFMNIFLNSLLSTLYFYSIFLYPLLLLQYRIFIRNKSKGLFLQGFLIVYVLCYFINIFLKFLWSILYFLLLYTLLFLLFYIFTKGLHPKWGSGFLTKIVNSTSVYVRGL